MLLLRGRTTHLYCTCEPPVYAVLLDHSETPAQLPVPVVAVEDAAEEEEEPEPVDEPAVPPEHALTARIIRLSHRARSVRGND